MSCKTVLPCSLVTVHCSLITLLKQTSRPSRDETQFATPAVPPMLAGTGPAHSDQRPRTNVLGDWLPANAGRASLTTYPYGFHQGGSGGNFGRASSGREFQLASLWARIPLLWRRLSAYFPPSQPFKVQLTLIISDSERMSRYESPALVYIWDCHWESWGKRKNGSNESAFFGSGGGLTGGVCIELKFLIKL